MKHATSVRSSCGTLQFCLKIHNLAKTTVVPLTSITVIYILLLQHCSKMPLKIVWIRIKEYFDGRSMTSTAPPAINKVPLVVSLLQYSTEAVWMWTHESILPSVVYIPALGRQLLSLVGIFMVITQQVIPITFNESCCIEKDRCYGTHTYLNFQMLWIFHQKQKPEMFCTFLCQLIV